MTPPSATDDAARWAPGPLRPPRPSPEVHVWRADLDAAPAPSADDLAPEELARARALRNPDSRRRWAAARWALRRILARYSGTEPAALVLSLGLHGKPLLAAPDAPRFSLSHTGGLMLVAVSADRDVGVDAERLRSERDVAALARRGLPTAEAAAVTAAPAAERTAVFYRLWVRHEARLKCHGTGLAAPVPDAPLTLVDIDAGPGVAAAVAASGAAAVGLRRFTLDG